MLQDLVLAVLVEKEPIKLAPNSAQISALLAQTKQNIFHLKPPQVAAPTKQPQQQAPAQPAGGGGDQTPPADDATAAAAAGEGAKPPLPPAAAPSAAAASESAPVDGALPSVPKTEPGTAAPSEVGVGSAPWLS